MIDYRVHKSVSMGKGVILSMFVVVERDAVIGDRVSLGAFSYVAPRVRIGTGAEIGPHACVLADVGIGEKVPAGKVWDKSDFRASMEALGATEKPPIESPTPRKRGTK